MIKPVYVYLLFVCGSIVWSKDTNITINALITNELRSGNNKIDATEWNIPKAEVSLSPKEAIQPRPMDALQKTCISRDQIEKCRSLVDKLSPEERTIRIREWRDKHGGITNRLFRFIENLREKRTVGRISPEEVRRLERLEIVAQRFEQSKRDGQKIPDGATFKKSRSKE